LEAERDRQQALLESGGKVEQVSLTFNAQTGQVKPMRSKEESHDYRYFPDPDLPPLVLDASWVAVVCSELPELPAAKRARFEAAFGLSPKDAAVLVSEQVIADYFESVVAAGADPKTAANWIMTDAMTGFNAAGAFTVPPASLTELIALIKDGTVSHQAAKRVFAEMTTSGGAPADVAARLGLLQVRDSGALEAWVDEVLVENPKEVERYKGGEVKLLAFLTGQVMKKSRGKADPKGVQPVLVRKLEAP
ncbi:MAG: Asp-tRNA(Asn)/Glu-tRNA(Gln) amidotransferase GatCAB subunit B, partial [Gemmatimonadales bacterium]|nr:Asp-tRNA(Asn)/Glu-tRNA(Gln) amidotransferase GatCAB subunit B [Gemmatimonadales bacterium]